jgi:deazaflavin-dependent oxidoreductase (nitroreductase family)
VIHVPDVPEDQNAHVIAEFRANGGKVPGNPPGMELLLLHHIGAKSGSEYVNPLSYLADGDRYVVFASNMAAPKHPGWYHNLKSHPACTIEVGDQTLTAVAEEMVGDQRDALYAEQARLLPFFAEYEKQTDRTIPVVALTPKVEK